MKHIPVILFGAGGVGSAVLRQIVDGRSPAYSRNHVHFNVVAVCDSQTWQFQPGGLSDDQLRDILARRRRGR